MDRRKMSLLPLCVLLAMALAGCWAGDSGLGGYLTGESYPDAERYQSGGFSYDPSQIERVELYWRAGEVELVESEEETLSVQESGEALTGDSAMRWLLEDGVLRLRFCASGARIRVSAADKRLHLELPKGIDLSLHTSSAAVRAETLEQDEILIATLSSGMELGAVTAEGSVDLSSGSGAIQAESVTAEDIRCASASGSVQMGTAAAGTLAVETASGAVRLGDVSGETVDISTGSGSVELTLTEAPTAAIRTASGTVGLKLAPEGALVAFTTGSGRLRTTLPYVQEGDLYAFGDGQDRITVETGSGGLRIQ